MSTVHIAGIGDRCATAYESGLSNKTFAFRDQPRRVLIVEGNETKLHAMMSETIQGQGFDVISVDEASYVNGGTRAATISPEADSAHASIERQLWNDAVDQRKADRKKRRRLEQIAAFYREKLGAPYPGDFGVTSTPERATGEEPTQMVGTIPGPTIAELQARGVL